VGTDRHPPDRCPPAGDGGHPGVLGQPVPFRVRARWGDRILAESVAAVRVEPLGLTPLLCLPLADIRTEELVDDGRTASSPVTGTSKLMSVAPAPGRTEPTGDGRDVLQCFIEPPPDLGWLTGLAAFDHDRVIVEVVDGCDGDDPRDVTVKRFPTWGDATNLIDLLDVHPEGGGRYVSATQPNPRRPVVEGSQILGQAIVAAARQAPGRRVVSAHAMFLRVADVTHPLRIELEELAGGRTFTGLAARAYQGTRCCAAGELLLAEAAPDVVRHAVPMPSVAGPYESEPFDMAVTGRDLRVVDGAYDDDPDAPVGPPVLDAWVRFREVPDDESLHAALLAQFTGHMPIAAALRPHRGLGQHQAHHSLSTAINAISISFHSAVRADRWMLYHHHSTFAGDGMTHAQCSVHTEDGALVASFSVDAMVRPFRGGAPPVDRSTAL
jgi:acyl-CoA thioesterase-2